MEKQVNSGAVLISAVLGTREYFDSWKVFWSKTFYTFKYDVFRNE